MILAGYREGLAGLSLRQMLDVTFAWLTEQSADGHVKGIIRTWVHTGQMPKDEEDDKVSVRVGETTIQTGQDQLDTLKEFRAALIAGPNEGEG